MRKFFLSIIVSLLSFSITAQSWCPPNAQWLYTCDNITWTGYTQLTYAGTVTVNGQLCQQINHGGQRYNYMFNNTVTVNGSPYYTSFSNNVVFLLNQNTSIFDTLYNFSAIPGSQWLLPAINTNTNNPCNKSRVTVLDTGHRVVESVNLKWFKILIQKDNSTLSDTIYERIGLLSNYFFNYDNCTSAFDYVEGGPLRCYSDNQILNFKKIAFACNYVYNPNSVSEKSPADQITIHPNPVSNTIIVQLRNATSISKIQMTDVLGRLVKEEEITGSIEKVILSIGDLNKGIYFLKLYSDQKLFLSKKVIKE